MVEANWDARGIRRAVENLCTNAVKYGAPGTEVRVRLGREGKTVTIQVHNQGNPLRAEDLPRLFELFQRTPSAEQSGKTGWGLGLTIVRGVTESHGGRVSVDSSPTAGTTFTLAIPASVEEPAASSHVSAG